MYALFNNAYICRAECKTLIYCFKAQPFQSILRKIIHDRFKYILLMKQQMNNQTSFD